MPDETDAPVVPKERDVIITPSNGSAQQANQMLQDAIHLQRVLFAIQKAISFKKEANDVDVDPMRTELSDIEPMKRKIYDLMTMGKPYVRACLRAVPSPFMDGPGRFLVKDEPNWRVATEDEAIQMIGEKLLEDFKSAVDIHSPPYGDFVRLLEREAENAKLENSAAKAAELKDIVLLPRDDLNDELSRSSLERTSGKMLETQVGNSVLFDLTSQFVTSSSNTSERRVEAALSVMQGLDDVDIIMPTTDHIYEGSSSNSAISKRPRFLVRRKSPDGKGGWSSLNLFEAVEFVCAFVYEVWLEKELSATVSEAAAEPDLSVPIKEPTEFDVLLGRGGLTNGWPGNKRFRDIIALHRADYIRAIKMDKPAVARKIVRAIRMGNPPGRFLRKGEDGLWYDTGDKTAAEKTSQALRERTNNEKRQRSELRKALRIRKVDFEDEDSEGGYDPSKRPKLANTALRRMAPTLNYVGTSLPVPLSLTMNSVVPMTRKFSNSKGKLEGEFITAGLPPNAVDSEGNILVTDYDILCGRGGLTNHHKGNRRFRDIVALHRPDYVRASKIQKPSVARVIVRAIRNGDPPGRFLKKDEKTGKWIDIGDKKAAEKTSQALREKTDDDHHSTRPDPGTVGVLLPTATGYLAGEITANVMGNFLAATARAPADPDVTMGSEQPAETTDETHKPTVVHNV